ncbi:hypothetical protein EGX20_10340, partial [Enterococcus faecium]|uniref:hypothetical protein n=1 Tax=Enterococcus faecium TaxID=1352 RepID=UPI000F9825C4
RKKNKQREESFNNVGVRVINESVKYMRKSNHLAGSDRWVDEQELGNETAATEVNTLHIEGRVRCEK